MKIQKSSKRVLNLFIFIAVAFLIAQIPIHATQIIVHANTHPATVSKGQPTEIIVKALTPQGMPIPQAHVKISAGGGFFLHSSTTTVHGQTDGNGMFGTPWKCNQCAPAYVFAIEVTKPGFQKGTAQAQVNITSQPMPGPGGQIIVHANTHPATVSKGQPTEIIVKALTAQGMPIPQAHVKISAGGGFFLHSSTTTVHGQTDANGMFGTPWKCNQCAPAYVFGIEVTKPGFQKGTAQPKVNITSQPMPGNPLPDLVISSVHIYPAQPTAGTKFTVVVYVANKGNAVSGKFDLAMYMKDITRGHTYPVGTFRRNAMHPGEQIPWQKQDLMVNNPGSYQYWVEIKPFLFKDKNNQNNTRVRAFTVK